jgi:seryl-tRNA synthetase
VLDIHFVRDNAGLVEDDLKKRGDDARIAWVRELLELDSKWRKANSESNELREKRNKITKEIEELRRKNLILQTG